MFQDTFHHVCFLFCFIHFLCFFFFFRRFVFLFDFFYILYLCFIFLRRSIMLSYILFYLFFLCFFFGCSCFYWNFLYSLPIFFKGTFHHVSFYSLLFIFSLLSVGARIFFLYFLFFSCVFASFRQSFPYLKKCTKGKIDG